MAKSAAALHALAVIVTLAACGDRATATESTVTTSLDKNALVVTTKVAIPAVELVAASDGVPLAYYPFRAREPVAALVFYHGGGAHSLAGYQTLADALAREYRISTFLVDIRGHGRSGGARGDAPSAEQVWRDVSTVVEVVRSQIAHVPLFVGGHSSGAGMLLNYLDREPSGNIAGIAFVAPELGYRADVKRDSAPQFARPTYWKFVVNALTAGFVCGHCEAVRFDYPEADITRAQLVPAYTVNMVKAVTPHDPAGRLARLKGRLGVWVGTDDELFDTVKLARFLDAARSPSLALEFHTVPQAKHLSILVNVDAAVAGWMTKTARMNQGRSVEDRLTQAR
jgi:acylglycerol lipase